MAEPSPGFQASEGDPNQLPRGAAEAVNEGTNVVAPEPVELAPPAPAAAPAEDAGADAAPASLSDFDPQVVLANEDEEFLSAPTERPSEPQSAGTAPRQGIPPRAARNLQLLQQAASAPGASAQLQALVNYLIRNA